MDIKPYLDHHKEAVNLVQSLQEKIASPAQNAEEINKMLITLTGKLKFHLSMEDKFIYPKAVSSSNAELQTVAKKMQAEMAPIGAALSSYAAAWGGVAAIKAKPDAFVAETKKIISALKSRIETEEKSFYPLVSKHL